MADLVRAAEAGNLGALRKHLRAGKDCNTQTRSTKATPLIWATRKQRVRAVKLLLKCEGIDPDIQDSNGNTALHYACRNKDATVAGLLIGAGANLSLTNERNEAALQLSDWALFKSQCLDQLDSDITEGIASRRLANAQSVIARLEVEEAQQHINRLRSKTKDLDHRRARLQKEATWLHGQQPLVIHAEEQGRVLQDLMFTRLGEVRADHMMIRKRSLRMGEIAQHMEDQIESLDEKAIKFDQACGALEEEIEELTAGLAAKTDTLTPMRIFPDDEGLQETCVAGLLSLLYADKTEAIHQGLSGENCSALVDTTQARFPHNHRIAKSGAQVVSILEEYKSSMRAAKVGH
jgi:hypothetical protein